MNAIARLEYVLLRLIRRFLLTERVANAFSGLIPYYRSSVNETNPDRIVSAYVAALSRTGHPLAGHQVLEIGAGRTNVVAYGLVAAGAGGVVALEPFVEFESARDSALASKHHPGDAKALQVRVQRTRSFGDVPDASVDIILSNSVLEHVIDPRAFFSDCRRVLRTGGTMLHMVDYRDHFFKYPYAFLTFSESVWSRWLNPGDLPRWRVYDHVASMQEAGFRVDVVAKESDAAEFARIRHLLVPPFAGAPDDVAVTYAVLYGQPA